MRGLFYLALTLAALAQPTDSVSLLNGAGRPITRVAAGAPFSLNFVYATGCPPHVAFVVYGARQVEPQVQVADLRPGQNSLRSDDFVVSRPGRYAAYVVNAGKPWKTPPQEYLVKRPFEVVKPK